MATTSPDNIWTPDSGDDYALTVDLAAMADTVQDALTAVPRNYLVGTNAQRLALSGGGLFEGLRFFATDTDVEWLYDGAAWIQVGSLGTAFTPTWTAASSAPSLGNGTLVGRYSYISRKRVALRYFLTFGSTTSGGAGIWSFSLPSGMVAQTSGEQGIACKAYLAGLGHNYSGIAMISGGGTTLAPNFPVSASASNLAPAQNASAGGAAGTGVPVHAGNYSYAASSNVLINGILEIN